MGTVGEASMNFDLELVEPFLQSVSGLMGGFGPEQVRSVVRIARELAIDEEREVVLPVVYRGKMVELTIQVFKDDEDAPDLYFLTVPELAEVLDARMLAFAEEMGI